jgi:hypothetical protein
MKNMFAQKYRDYWIPFLLGSGAFWFITGGRIIRPSKISWLMINDDSAQHYLGWVFYRHAPLVQWPLGAIKNFGMEISSSIVYTDSIPLLAFIFKPFNHLLPEKFQFLGIWILICFILQALFAWKLLSLFSRDRLLILFGSAFFVLAPAPLWRMAGHHALFGHWVILAAIYFYLSHNCSVIRWTVLLLSAVLIHVYFLGMVGCIFIADLIQRIWKKQIGVKEVFYYVPAVAACILFFMWAAGYFMLGSGIAIGQAGVYRTNLLSIIDPNGWSKLLLDQSNGGSEPFEAFNFLGIGIILLGVISIYEYILNPRIKCNNKSIIPLAIVMILFTLYAISNHIEFGNIECFHYKWPPILDYVVGAFRGTSRFFWPVYYVLYLFSIGYLFAIKSGNKIRIIVGAILCFQLFDTWDIYAIHYRKMISFAPAWSTPLQSEEWRKFGYKYRSVVIVPPCNNPPNWIPLSEFAANNGMSTNFAYYARIDTDRLNSATKKLSHAVLHRRFDPDSLYIFNDETLWNATKASALPQDFIGVVDGFKIYAPVGKQLIGAHPPQRIINVLVNGKKAIFSNGFPHLGENGKTLVPLDFFNRYLGANVNWNKETQNIDISKDKTAISLKIGERQAIINGKTTAMFSPVILEEGVAMVPVRVPSEALGATIGWDAAIRNVSIDTGKPIRTKGIGRAE